MTQVEEKRQQALASHTTASLRELAREAAEKLRWSDAGLYLEAAIELYPADPARSEMARLDIEQLRERVTGYYQSAWQEKHQDYRTADGFIALDPLTGATIAIRRPRR